VTSFNLICDLDGVLFLGETPVPGAAEALAELAAGGCNLIFATNNSFRARNEVAAKIQRVTGFPATANQVVTSADAAARLIAADRPMSFVLGGDGITASFEEAGIPCTTDWTEAEMVVVGMTPEFSYRWLNDAAAAVRAGARLLATNDDATYPTSEGEQPGAGALLAAVEKASGGRALVAGKPYQPMKDLLATRLADGPTWVVGDRAETDLALAEGTGWKSILVLTGVGRPDDQPSPDYVLDSIADVPAFLSSRVA